ncbi:cell adhesion molecule CEACAM5-like [Neosynchiropus ocellatus]
MELRRASNSDSGTYSVAVVTTGGNQRTGSTELRVHVPITGPQLTFSHEDLLEFSSSVTFSCSVSSGSSLSFLWQNISSEISASDEVQITEGESFQNLTILSVTRYDQGPFRCTVFNAVSRVVSDPVTLSISYGPDDVDLQVSPSQEYFEEGSNIRLSCSSSSSPPARLQWFVNDTLTHTGPELLLTAATEAQSGNYSCQAFNSKTLRYRTSSAAVTVLVAIRAASLTASTNLPIEGMSVNLSCDAAGSVYSRLWRKDGTTLTPDANMMLGDGNRTLSFKSVRRSDDGVYSCLQSNPLHSSTLDHRMVVNFGPEQVTITGPAAATVPSSVTLTCTAVSTPAASFTWKHNGMEKENSSVFTIKKSQTSDSGSYVCEARNNVTGKSLTQTHELSVTESPCSTGCIAAIVAVCSIVIIAAAVGGFYLYKRR